MDIAVKLTLVAALVMMGYNISEFVTSYETICAKTEEFKLRYQEGESLDDLLPEAFAVARLTKVDALFNAALGLGIALIVVL